MNLPAFNPEQLRLSVAQAAALQYVESYAVARRIGSRRRIAQALERARVAPAAWEAALNQVRSLGQVVMHFHPDRLDADGRTIAEALLKEGVYRNQFETGLTNGGRTAYPGGGRDRWEERLFGGVYQAADVPPSERPKYGAFDLIRRADGPAPRFGSCWLVLRPEVSQRCTFSYGDSHQEPDHLGTLHALDCVMAAFLEDLEQSGCALGSPGFTVAAAIEHLQQELASPRPQLTLRPAQRPLDQYIEAQIHGPIDLDCDVEALVADPAFQHTPVGGQLDQACARHGIQLEWHPGFALPVDTVDDRFRGPIMPRLAQQVAPHGLLDAAAIGAAAADLHRQPERWQNWGTPDEAWGYLKQLWHVVAHFGMPRSALLG